ncbi:hypothetical protein C2G38_146105 [Gigaspora rosea]|uniref:Uncharacterized protein n=1 Tax=Gigaspora rosea TaxID=44941 RepID=A0A397UL22_9GLOM|nr:hypothetical protein C2G38_146105 [Gigaspora rosea]
MVNSMNYFTNPSLAFICLIQRCAQIFNVKCYCNNFIHHFSLDFNSSINYSDRLEFITIFNTYYKNKSFLNKNTFIKTSNDLGYIFSSCSLRTATYTYIAMI